MEKKIENQDKKGKIAAHFSLMPPHTNGSKRGNSGKGIKHGGNKGGKRK